MPPAPDTYFALALIGPAILALFSFCFLGLWAFGGSRNYILLFSAACFVYSLAAIVQIAFWPADTGQNTILSALLYTTSVVMIATGVLQRAGQNMSPLATIVIFTMIMVPIWYFFYIEPSLIARVYILNFGYGFVFIYICVRLVGMALGPFIDRFLYWVLVAFAFHFFIRTTVTIDPDLGNVPGTFGRSVFWLVLQVSLAIFGAVMALTLLAACVADLLGDMERDRDTDLLTRLLNRRGFERIAGAHMTRAAGRPVSLISCDIDHFKSLNDTYGHGAGDAVLKEFGALLLNTMRGEDVIGRIGGEEFAIMLTGADVEGARQFAERVRALLESTHFESVPDTRVVTASFGIAQYRPPEPLRKLLARADVALYSAKKAGRNRCFVAGQTQ
ncbi:GGDEF domain-containing protein [Roseixanthobacter glucoisosaccharinicivorans]|uniref:GGDEF domain-containing protein n=1 Tax=Roseixanthobacter glucoisosaccharinicivorans TaxID=3119923 RepID=UPI0037267DF5